jgi:hypothetical protein
VDLVRDVVAQLEQRERALVRDNGLLRPDRHPLLTNVIVLGGGEASDAIEPAPHAVKASLSNVVI